MKTTIPITGMSCATCSATVEDAVSDLDGVAQIDVNFATDEATLTFDPETVSLAEIYTVIEESGYSPERQTETIEVAGMSCATCAESTTKAIESDPGVLKQTSTSQRMRLLWHSIRRPPRCLLSTTLLRRQDSNPSVMPN